MLLGSALKIIGVDEFMQGIVEYSESVYCQILQHSSLVRKYIK